MSRRPLRRLLVASALLLGLAVGLLATLRHAPAWLDVGRLDEPARWALILGGDPSDRAAAAAALQTSGWVEGVLVTRPRPGPDIRAGLGDRQETIVVAILRRLGVPASAIHVLDGEVDSTFDEAAVLRRYLAEEPATVILVTEDYHTRRALFVFRRVLGSDAPLQIVGCPSSELSFEGPWWRDPFAVQRAIGELIKMGVQRVRY